jgi:hypothetical protein
MTDLEFIAAQHRVILNTPCSCNLPWKHGDAQPMCQRCKIVCEYEARYVR